MAVLQLVLSCTHNAIRTKGLGYIEQNKQCISSVFLVLITIKAEYFKNIFAILFPVHLLMCLLGIIKITCKNCTFMSSFAYVVVHPYEVKKENKLLNGNTEC